ncbi:hypothetical protein HD553DRAFT_175864 [Filobasidium floriforme]|uniref:uncharacterized protein n=1 Tax=Filobasidium floriforme TaxID=5210 RepID=UPI001E8D6B06|nr:uncharacterized protein HD553DRAFT_175864 [Filobasidium floriforme]KAH8088415.1 hypothetical protein HD553DRAFT_175864 [Filobasidium floriforme]
MSRLQDSTLERQNDSELNQLHGKIKSLRHVTIDILSDSQRQNEQLDRTSSSFTQLGSNLLQTTRQQARTFSQQSPARQLRTIGYIVAGLIVLWLLAGWWLRSGSGGKPGNTTGMGEDGQSLR